MIAWASEPLMRVSCAVMSVSFGPNTSSATRVIPACGASALRSSRPPAPYASDALRMATLASFRRWRSLTIFFTARMSLAATLNTHGRTGSTIFRAAAQEMRGTFAPSTLGMMASVLPDVLGPTTATTRSRLRRRSAAVTALVASVSSS